MSKIDEDDIKTVSKEQADDSEIGTYVKFAQPYIFEDEEYEGLDLSRLREMKAGQINDIERKFYRLGISSVNPENTVAYAFLVAQEATGLPIEFFQQLPIKEAYKIKSRVVNFFYS